MKKVIIVILLAMLVFSGCQSMLASQDKQASNKTVIQLTEQQEVFNEFWQLYDRYYPSFNRKSINWNEVYDKYYPKITASTTDNELFALLKEITILIDDGHTSVSLMDQEAVSADHSVPEIQETYEKIRPKKVIIAKDTELIAYGTLKDDPSIGYINSKVFMPMNGEQEASEEGFEKAMKLYEETIEEALVALKETKGIIIDVRGNGGGDGGLATHLAGRFFVKSPVDYSRKRIKIAAGSSENSFGAWVTQEFEGYKDSRSAEGTMASVGPEFNVLSKTGNHQYTKPVVVLTSWTTASSGEYFTAAMKTQPHVKTVGNRTCGIFSGSEAVTLKSGGGKWKTNISVQDTEFIVDGSFQGLEGKGLSPDYLIIPTLEDIQSNRDVHIEKAVEIIRSSNK